MLFVMFTILYFVCVLGFWEIRLHLLYVALFRGGKEIPGMLSFVIYIIILKVG